MLFHEVYSNYYRAVASILREAQDSSVTRQRMREITQQLAFGESCVTIPAALSDGTWPLLTRDAISPLRHEPTMPLTELEKRWMKTLLLDPRIRLFDPPTKGLEDVEPIFNPQSIVYYDQYTDGDPYDDPDYIEHFHAVLKAIREKRNMRIRFKSSHGTRNSRLCTPYRIEYSAKDDKFRVFATSEHQEWTVNIARISSYEILEEYSPEKYHPRALKKDPLVMIVKDERNALERVMLHFSHFEKETERIDDQHYRLSLRYEREDETELLIRVLSFGPLLQVIAPNNFVDKIQDRLKKQQMLLISPK